MVTIFCGRPRDQARFFCRYNAFVSDAGKQRSPTATAGPAERDRHYTARLQRCEKLIWTALVILRPFEPWSVRFWPSVGLRRYSKAPQPKATAQATRLLFRATHSRTGLERELGRPDDTNIRHWIHRLPCDAGRRAPRIPADRRPAGPTRGPWSSCLWRPTTGQPGQGPPPPAVHHVATSS